MQNADKIPDRISRGGAGERNLDFDRHIERRNTDSLKYDFAVRRGRPADVLPLWVADMDFQTSGFIIDALTQRAQHGIFGYTETREDYFEAVAGWMKRHHGMDLKINWLVKTPGVVFALAMAVRAYTEPGDAVLIQQPVYYPLTEVVVENKRKLVSNDLVSGSDGKYRIDFEDFERKIVDHRIKLFMFCSPHNPVGRVWTVEELQKLAEICIRHRVIVVSDEIHEDFVCPGHKHTPLLTVNPGLEELCVTCTSPSKTFNLAGLQIANIIIPDRKLRHAFRAQVSAAGYSQLNSFGVTACKAAYTKGDEWHAAVLRYIHENLDFLMDYLKRELPQIRLVEPEGTYLVWLDFTALGLDAVELEDLITKKAGLWLDNGLIFGKTGEGYERINIATNRSILQEALDRIRQAVKQYEKRANEAG